MWDYSGETFALHFGDKPGPGMGRANEQMTECELAGWEALFAPFAFWIFDWGAIWQPTIHPSIPSVRPSLSLQSACLPACLNIRPAGVESTQKRRAKDEKRWKWNFQHMKRMPVSGSGSEWVGGWVSEWVNVVYIWHRINRCTHHPVWVSLQSVRLLRFNYDCATLETLLK